MEILVSEEFIPPYGVYGMIITKGKKKKDISTLMISSLILSSLWFSFTQMRASNFSVAAVCCDWLISLP
jgi:hypothetical protein